MALGPVRDDGDDASNDGGMPGPCMGEVGSKVSPRVGQRRKYRGVLDGL